jgi:HD-GYP domain-containing protein (c-di-GMP phosphodiesterase class II)
MMGALEFAFERFASDCGEFGLPAWRVDAVRREWQSPQAPALVAFASNEAVLGAIASVAASLDEDGDTLVIVNWLGGTKLILVRERIRRQRFGWVATVLPSPGCGKNFAEEFEAGGLDANELEVAFDAAMTVGDTHIESLGRLLLRIYERAVVAYEDDKSLEDFTTQLMMAYESTVMISNIAQSMSRVDDSSEVLAAAIDELFMTLPFGWAALVCAEDPEFAKICSTRVISRFDADRFDNETIEQAAISVIASFADSTELSIEPCPLGLNETLGPELIVQPITIEGATRAILVLGSRAGDEWAVSSYDTVPVRAVAASITAYLEIVLAYQRQQEAFVGTLRGLSKALDAKDSYTRGHSDRVAYLAEQLGRAVGLNDEQARQIYVAGLVHDIGKIGVPESVLCGDKKLTDEEFAQIQSHPGIGHDILKGIPMLGDALPGVLHHHERWDGKGYPQGKSAEEIPLIARILGLVDAFDAMSSNRSYQTSQRRDDVLSEIRACCGTHFDPELVDRFLELDLTEYDRMLAEEASAIAKSGQARSRDRAA